MSMKPILVATVALSALATSAHAEFSMTVLHTNDVHSRIEPISKYDSTCSAEDNTAGDCFGGMARVLTAINEARSENENVLLVDGGDQFQGTLFYTYYKGKAAAEFMNQMGYDAMTVGNHEFDDGPEVLRGFMDAVDFPVLMSNADVSGEPMLDGVLNKSTVVTVGGETIGLIGLTPEDTGELSSPGSNITFSDPIEAVRGEVERFEAQGINKIVVLSHSGYNVDLAVAEAVEGVDVIVGGHSNTFLSNVDDGAAGPYPTMVGDTAVVQAYAYTKYLGELQVTFDDDGNVISATGEPRLLDASVTEDDAVVTRVVELAGPLDEIRREVIGATTAPIDGDRGTCRATECEMGALVTTAMLERVADQGVQIAITNGGGLRASIDEGDITMGEVLTVLPFQNTLATFDLTGAGIVEALENGVSQVEDGGGRFPQIAGMRFTWDPAAEVGSRIVSVEVEGADGTFSAIDPDATYGVVSNNFMRGGGDGYAVFAEQGMNAYDYGPGLDVVVAEYLTEAGEYTPATEDRIMTAE
ncbi:multifunctional 2',3'-cyclic-nucleotide 2'-phosphodiesterase/5'-nucleotidase/3'-nucleotidase [Pontibrevibacter nitratireducens]|uniref:Multifunctional 2',3'-cyclic-nucleotide 2'-phosphodiesterase/5'-nucleotidase/3'-nucleotidase n=2 Tax=Pontivivens nitratireducens TaxID=2758038 RepID=A0A6G7VPK2_9RHOB|nr:bifunctional metallophosphatase/5'-nucleotidase [Pontibrevibacter nitratireducens]QIK41806.1 multifunctional 2',3'-cyclic-nucleotide 2'-phosphodiesterase/5'-nucleotidase/3'-nucleotidase [Pontibrevibacter nitratireducens]